MEAPSIPWGEPFTQGRQVSKDFKLGMQISQLEET
jgi:hypothetical protein